MRTTFSQKSSYMMMRNRMLEIPVTTMMTILGAGLVLILFIITAVGLLVGALKEVFIFIGSSQGFSTKTTFSNPDPVNVLITQE